MNVSSWIVGAQWFFLLFFVGINLGYLLLNLLSWVSLRRYMGARLASELHPLYSGFEPPVSILVTAYNEEAIIATSVRSLLQLNYPEFEVVVINDGSKDDTLGVLAREFALRPFPEAYRGELPCKRVRGFYRSAIYPNVRVVDKENGGGKADALNAGVNAARYPLFLAMDADSVLERDSLQRVAQPFVEDPTVIASGGTVRIVNGCSVKDGFLTAVGVPRNLLALFQIVEYLRAFLFARMGLSAMNAVLIVSGAFGLFKRDSVVEAGGYRTDTLGEDMELVVRLHRLHRLKGKPYRVAFVPHPICWTEAPESLSVLKKQRIRWQRGLAESLTLNSALMFHPRGGAPGWFAIPFMTVFEWWGPLIEVAGYVFITLALFSGMISIEPFLIFLALSFGFGIVLSLSALLLEEIFFHVYTRPKHLALLLFAAVAENFGYRQVISFWRLVGLLRWLTRREEKWGEMKRTATWQQQT
jgi:cellulose synthase/poly-beta-1,6-N-acetylglucosamine synthase-like glycosyltransferase